MIYALVMLTITLVIADAAYVYHATTTITQNNVAFTAVGMIEYQDGKTDTKLYIPLYRRIQK